MKCISLWQPWASLIAVGAKKIETRSWTTSYRGVLAIHAAKVFNRESRDFWMTSRFVRARVEQFNALSPDVPLGAFVAVCRLADVKTAFQLSGTLGAEEEALGNYGIGRYGWILEDVQPLSPPVPAKGAQGLWSIMPELAERIMANIKK